MPDILLCALNARYIHASLGLRYLLANLGELQERAAIAEFIIGQRPAAIVEAVLQHSPRIVGFGVYIWNVEETERVIGILKAVRPDIVVVLGGPEVSHETASQRVVNLADHVITGWGDVTFRKLCERLLAGEDGVEHVLAGEQPPLESIALPYAHYTDQDLAQRLVYVEASRGCPFKCEFCLSSLDRTAWPFDQERFLAALDSLHRRGARHFKFVDRTFNLNVNASRRILEFFLERLDERLFLHFEVVPDHLPDRLKEVIVRFPPGQLQFEIGIQTWNPTVQALISRRQDEVRTEANLRWLRESTGVHLHTDLIAGLPGETLQSIAAGFDRLVALRPHEIQVGILKRLRGTPIARHAHAHNMRFSPQPPYEILSSDALGFADLQRLGRFARYWDLVGNSGRFSSTLPLLLSDAPFQRFMQFSDWLHGRTGQTHAIALDRLYEHVHAALTGPLAVSAEEATTALRRDYEASGARGNPSFLGTQTGRPRRQSSTGEPDGASRQGRHLRGEAKPPAPDAG